MDEFDNMFSDVGEDTVALDNETKSKSNDYSNNNYNNNSYGGKKKFDNKPIYTNVEGKQEINVWNGDRVPPLELDMDSLKTNEKFVTMVLGNKFYSLSEEEISRFIVLSKLLKEKGFKLRIICSNVKPVYNHLKEVFGDDIIHITPWKGYCKDMKDIKQYLASDSNLKAAAFYFNNKFKKYNDLPAGIKLVKAATISSLVGLENNELSQIVILHDRNYNGKKIDFKQSQQSSDYILLAKPLNLNLYNIAMPDGYKTLKQLLS
jgi:hypothetical protein